MITADRGCGVERVDLLIVAQGRILMTGWVVLCYQFTMGNSFTVVNWSIGQIGQWNVDLTER